MSRTPGHQPGPWAFTLPKWPLQASLPGGGWHGSNLTTVIIGHHGRFYDDQNNCRITGQQLADTRPVEARVDSQALLLPVGHSLSAFQIRVGADVTEEFLRTRLLTEVAPGTGTPTDPARARRRE